MVKAEQGFEGFTLKDQRRYSKGLRWLRDLCLGELFYVGFWMPRSPKHHRFFMLKVRALLGRQETFTDFDDLRYWLVMGAGYCSFVPGRDGNLMAIPKSISYKALDEVEFTELRMKVDDFLWTGYAQATLWPALMPEIRQEAVEQLMADFQRDER